MDEILNPMINKSKRYFEKKHLISGKKILGNLLHLSCGIVVSTGNERCVNPLVFGSRIVSNIQNIGVELPFNAKELRNESTLNEEAMELTFTHPVYSKVVLERP